MKEEIYNEFKNDENLKKKCEKIGLNLDSLLGFIDGTLLSNATIKVKKDKGLVIEASGARGAILLALASGEKKLLDQLKCDNKEFEIFKTLSRIVEEVQEKKHE